MGRFAMLVAAAVMLAFASPATAQNSEGSDMETTESAAQGQYGPSTQAIEEGIEDAIEDAQENNAAVDGTEAYVGTLSPEEAEAAEESVEPGASARYQSLPDTGGPSLSLPATAFLAVFLSGALLAWRR